MSRIGRRVRAAVNPLSTAATRWWCHSAVRHMLTGYGPIHEVWFDGANGEGPNGRRQEYDWPRVFALVRRLQPDALQEGADHHPMLVGGAFGLG